MTDLCFVVSRKKLDHLVAVCSDWREGSLFSALEECMEIEFPRMNILRSGIITKHEIDAVIELQRTVFPFDESDHKTPDQ